MGHAAALVPISSMFDVFRRKICLQKWYDVDGGAQSQMSSLSSLLSSFLGSVAFM